MTVWRPTHLSDQAAYYDTLRTRADTLRNDIDTGIHALLAVERSAQQVARADFGEPGELSATDYGDLQTCVSKALFYLRLGEHVAHSHSHELDQYLGKRDGC